MLLLMVYRCWRTMIMVVQWIGGAPVSLCMRWCVGGFRSTIVIPKSSLNLSSWKISVFHARSRRMPRPFSRAFSSKIQNTGLPDCENFSFLNHSGAFVCMFIRLGYLHAAWCTESTGTLLVHTYPNCVFPVVTLVSDQPLGETSWFLEHIDT